MAQCLLTMMIQTAKGTTTAPDPIAGFIASRELL